MIPLHKPWYDRREGDAVVRAMRSGNIAGNGKECAALEDELKRFLGAKYAMAVSSGTHALEMALELANVRGKEVILPSFTFPSAANAVIRAGADPVFCEVREVDLNMDINHALSRVNENTGALIVTHYGGHPLSFREVPVPVVEDAAHAFGSRIRRRMCGTMGVFGCFSFHATKNVAAGEGGALVCRSGGARERVTILREKGTNRDAFMAGKVKFYSWVGGGSSFVMPELSAAIVRVQLSKISKIIKRRQNIASFYDRALCDMEAAGRIKIVKPVRDVCSSYHIYAVLVAPEWRKTIISKMRDAGIETASHYVPLHTSPYARVRWGEVSLSQTERISGSILRLPIYPGLTVDEQHKIATRLKRVLKRF